MAQMIEKLLVALLLMLIPPIGILYYCVNENAFPGSTNLLSGLLAFIAVNMVIVFFVCMTMDKPSDKQELDPTNASANQSTSEAEDSSQSRDKED